MGKPETPGDLAAMLDRRRLAMYGCHGIVIRDGYEDACGKPVVAIIDARDCEEGDYWPACTYHAHRYGRGRVVPLTAVIAALVERTGVEG